MKRASLACALAAVVPVVAAARSAGEPDATRAGADAAGARVHAESTRAGSAAGMPQAETLAKQAACTHCHAAEGTAAERLEPVAIPALAGIGLERSPGWIESYLLDGPASHPQVLDPDPEKAALQARQIVTALTAYSEVDFEPVEVTPAERQQGERLFAEVGCFACHADGFAGRDLAGGWSIAALSDALQDPSSHRVLAGRMPDLQLEPGEARAIATWLLRAQRDDGPEEIVPGLRYSYYEEPDWPAEGVDWAPLEPVSTGIAPVVTHELGDRRQHYGLLFEGMVRVPEDGSYRFWTASDDGSELFLDGERVVENLGHHPIQRRESAPIKLTEGWHALRITFFEQAGGEGLEAGWSGPGFDARPFQPDELAHAGSVPRPVARAFDPVDEAGRQRGMELLMERGCFSCHERELPKSQAVPLASLPAAAEGCLAPPGDVPTGDEWRGFFTADPVLYAPRYDFDDEERAMLVGMLRDRAELQRPRGDAAEVAVSMQIHQCTACHARGGVEGPSEAALASFVGADDLGEEGRVPPDLTGVGGKLRPEALRDAIAHGLEYRPALRTRMPAFHDVDPELAPSLTRAFTEVDAPSAARPAPVFDAAEAELGQRLTGTQGGLACIACHGAVGNPSVGVQGPSLSDMAERLQYDWYARWMADPPGMRPGTRMLAAFTGGRSPIADVHGGDPAKQIDALWHYLSLADSMPLPPGLVVERSSYDLVPTERPVYLGAFWHDASARTLAVGFPERVSAAFDEHHCRLVEVWRGDFVNAQGTWQGRAGQLEEPAGIDVLPMPPGPAVAVLDEGDAWPAADKATVRMIEHRRDENGWPSWTYAIPAHGLTVTESLEPRLAAGGAQLLRRFDLSFADAIDRDQHPATRVRIRLADGRTPESARFDVTLGTLVEVDGATYLEPVWWERGSDRGSGADASAEVLMSW